MDILILFLFIFIVLRLLRKLHGPRDTTRCPQCKSRGFTSKYLKTVTRVKLPYGFYRLHVHRRTCLDCTQKWNHIEGDVHVMDE